MVVGANSTSKEQVFFGSMVWPEQVSEPPAIVNGAVGATLVICAAIMPLLASVTLFGLLVPVASTLPKFNLSGDAVSSVGTGVGVGVGAGVGFGENPVSEISNTVPPPS